MTPAIGAGIDAQKKGKGRQKSEWKAVRIRNETSEQMTGEGIPLKE